MTSERAPATPATPARNWLEWTWIAAAAGTLLTWLWLMVCNVPGIPWNAARLAPSFALARGLPIYALRDSGAHLGWVYGPVFPLWYAPFGFSDRPTEALMLAAGWNAVTILLPVFLVTRMGAGGSKRAGWMVFLVGALLLLANPITRMAFLFCHVDAVCVGWAVAACLALHAAAERQWKPGFPLAALAVALSVAAKQVSVVLLPATILWLWRSGHAGLILRWLFWLAVVCGGLAAVFFAAFGAEGMLFNAWLLFSRMPWQGGWGIAGRNVGQVLVACWPWFAVALLGLVAVRFRWRARVSAPAASLAALFFWLAIWQLPMGLTASMVVDAALNSIHATNYLLLAGLTLAASALASGKAAEPAPRGAGGLAAAIALGTALLSLNVADLVWRPYRGQDELLALARQHPGKIYLPWNPLITLITERKIYPFDEALRYLWLARLEPPAAAIRAAVPADPLIIYVEPSQTHFAMNYFGKNAGLPPVER